MLRRIAVVVPAHNEEQLIIRAVQQIPDFVDDIIVVDDASTDNTWEALTGRAVSNRVCCLRHVENQGVGGAIISGYRKAMDIGAEIVAVMAGDAQMDPDDLPSLLEPIVNGQADYVKGDRLCWPGVFREMPLERYIANHILSRLTRLTSGYHEVHDSQCGYTAIDVRVLPLLVFDDVYHRYGFPNDLLAHLHTVGARLIEVPVRPIYGSERSGISLFTALFKVPSVLIRSFWKRRKRESCSLIEPEKALVAVPGKRR